MIAQARRNLFLIKHCVYQKKRKLPLNKPIHLFIPKNSELNFFINFINILYFLKLASQFNSWPACMDCVVTSMFTTKTVKQKLYFVVVFLNMRIRKIENVRSSYPHLNLDKRTFAKLQPKILCMYVHVFRSDYLSLDNLSGAPPWGRMILPLLGATNGPQLPMHGGLSTDQCSGWLLQPLTWKYYPH